MKEIGNVKSVYMMASKVSYKPRKTKSTFT